MKLLHIDSSILGDNSASRQLSAGVVKAWQAAQPGVEVTYRDLASEGINHFSGATLGALGTAAELRDAAQKHEAELSASSLAEFLAADAVVVGAPMYNFTIPTQLKAWIDRIAVAGQTFRYTEAGPEGLCGNKKVIIVSTAGGLHADARMAQPQLRHFRQHRREVLVAVLRVPEVDVQAERVAHS